MKQQVICVKTCPVKYVTRNLQNEAVKNELILNKKYYVDNIISLYKDEIMENGKWKTNSYLVKNEFGYYKRYSLEYLVDIKQNRKNKLKKLYNEEK